MIQDKTRKLSKFFNAGTDFNALLKNIKKFLFILQNITNAAGALKKFYAQIPF